MKLISFKFSNKKSIPSYTKIFLLIGVIWFLNACKTSNTEVGPTETATIDATVAVKWMDTFLEVERYAPGYRPPVAARALGYINLAAYEAVVPSSAQYQSIAPKFAGLTIPKIQSGQSYNYQVAVNEAYYLMMKSFFPHVTDVYKAQIETQYKDFDISKVATDELDRSKKFGQAIATAVFEYSKTDATGHEAYLRNQPTDYVAPVFPGSWEPSFPDYGKALLPYWGKVRTFVISGADKVARPPLEYSTAISSSFFSQALEVYSMTTNLTAEQKWIGEFWSDDIYKLTFEPAGRWIAIAQQVIKKEKAPLDKAIYTYAKMSIGLSDIGVACWNSKYVYNIARPVVYIRTAIDTKWISKLNNPLNKTQGVTPPFPAYPSGHSCFGGVAAEVLSDIYGYNYGMTDYCHAGRTEFVGTPRSFNNFYEMAYENAYSRIPLGVHYRMDCEEGLRMGYAVGKKINLLGWKK
jgi:PAP2 superfamily